MALAGLALNGMRRRVEGASLSKVLGYPTNFVKEIFSALPWFQSGAIFTKTSLFFPRVGLDISALRVNPNLMFRFGFHFVEIISLVCWCVTTVSAASKARPFSSADQTRVRSITLALTSRYSIADSGPARKFAINWWKLTGSTFYYTL